MHLHEYSRQTIQAAPFMIDRALEGAVEYVSKVGSEVYIEEILRESESKILPHDIE